MAKKKKRKPSTSKPASFEAVTLMAAAFQRPNGVWNLQNAKLSIKTQHIFNEAEKKLRFDVSVHVGYDLEPLEGATNVEDDTELKITCHYRMRYHCEKLPRLTSKVKQDLYQSAVQTLWPYVGEFIHSSMTRMGITNLLFPEYAAVNIKLSELGDKPVAKKKKKKK